MKQTCFVWLAAFIVSASAWPAQAALPPYYQRQAEMERILGDARVEQALQSAPIDAIERTGEDEYRVYGGKCAVIVRIKGLPQPDGMVGPRRFELEIGAADCSN